MSTNGLKLLEERSFTGMGIGFLVFWQCQGPLVMSLPLHCVLCLTVEFFYDFEKRNIFVTHLKIVTLNMENELDPLHMVSPKS